MIRVSQAKIVHHTYNVEMWRVDGSREPLRNMDVPRVCFFWPVSVEMERFVGTTPGPVCTERSTVLMFTFPEEPSTVSHDTAHTSSRASAPFPCDDWHVYVVCANIR